MKRYCSLIFLCSMTFLSKLIGFSWILGTWSNFFSWGGVVAPVLSYHFGFITLAVWLLSSKIYSAGLLFFFLHRLPLVLGVMSYRYNSFILSGVIPFLSIIFFWSKAQSDRYILVYALYWLIPIVLYYMPDFVGKKALSTTMIMHAVGTVVWLLYHPFQAEFFWTLFPLVFIERLLMVCAMVLCDNSIVFVQSLDKKFGKIIKVFRLGAN